MIEFLFCPDHGVLHYLLIFGNQLRQIVDYVILRMATK